MVEATLGPSFFFLGGGTPLLAWSDVDCARGAVGLGMMTMTIVIV